MDLRFCIEEKPSEGKGDNYSHMKARSHEEKSEVRSQKQGARSQKGRGLGLEAWRWRRDANPESRNSNSVAFGFSLLASGFLLLASCLWAAEEPGRVEKTVDTTPNPRVSVTNLRGNVVVKGWDKTQIHALCTTASSKVEVDMEATPPQGQAERVRFQAHSIDAQPASGAETADYSLDVPVNSILDIRNSQGNVRVEKVQGDVHVSTVSAPVSVLDAFGHLQVDSVGGNIEIVHPSGRVEASSVNGDIRFTSPTSAELRGHTSSGRIVYQGDFAPRGNYDLSAYSGDVDVFCPRTASFELIAKGKGKVYDEFRMTPKPHTPSMSPHYQSFSGIYHQGKATLEVRSYSGAIHIRRQP